jgi:toxoflavin synthase
MAIYDSIANLYQESKRLPFRKHIEEYTLFKLMSDLQEKSVLDLACGEGIYSRKLKAMGAKTVVGVDISSQMIQLAEKAEKQAPLGIEYIVRDVADLPKLGNFDFVLGSFLLNYAKSKEQLSLFCTSIFKNLKSKGRFVGFNDNPSNDPRYFMTYKKYGFIKSTAPNRNIGDPIRYTFFNSDQTEFQIDNYYLSKEIYEEVFQDVGFQPLHWHSPLISPEGIESFEPGYWSEFIEHPPFISLQASKS